MPHFGSKILFEQTLILSSTTRIYNLADIYGLGFVGGFVAQTKMFKDSLYNSNNTKKKNNLTPWDRFLSTLDR